jgi:XTP/dITP diphosphohydrolase
MSHQLLLATRNKGKIEEFRRILDAIAPGEIELIGLESFPDLHDVVEDGSTFQENAIKKAREMSIASGNPAIADDSGLCVDFLNGAPGIFSARWAGSHGNDAANTEKVLQQLDGVPEDQRGAHFTCVAALYLPDGRSHWEEAQFHGTILLAPVGEHGFGYDPIFQPAGFAISSAQMSAEEKDSISHRGKSLRAIAPHVITLLNTLG